MNIKRNVCIIRETFKSAVDTPPELEGSLSTKLLLSVHRNVSWLQMAVICSSEPQLASMRQEIEEACI